MLAKGLAGRFFSVGNPCNSQRQGFMGSTSVSMTEIKPPNCSSGQRHLVTVQNIEEQYPAEQPHNSPSKLIG